MDGEQLPKLDLAKDAQKLSTSDLHFMKKVEQINLERVTRLKRVRKNNILLSSCLGIGVLSIYFYTIYAVKQEKFFDDFEVPETTADRT